LIWATVVVAMTQDAWQGECQTSLQVFNIVHDANVVRFQLTNREISLASAAYCVNDWYTKIKSSCLYRLRYRVK